MRLLKGAVLPSGYVGGGGEGEETEEAKGGREVVGLPFASPGAFYLVPLCRVLLFVSFLFFFLLLFADDGEKEDRASVTARLGMGRGFGYIKKKKTNSCHASFGLYAAG